ncbi:protein kinase domain-containing protein [Tsukamurella paurometabola]|uniref:non-specific serine/threonine protein kinase n=1 Tax=Tsukamurella paurometabola TaxID=2061 RepID=A0A3P8KEA9_TSUPA|nr:protein kinase [Tsukamurella paurometabola]UEA81125.1 protein kinase [Tsukamurella paurometabola]VDR38098.1 Serine/threonine-protein kinase pknF [Tsukamurella paurometabola]
MAGNDQDLEIAGYRVIDRLGAGGMGQVFLVAHPRLPRSDALKLLDGAVSSSEEFQARFIHEADLLAPLSHPNIVHLYDRGRLDDGRLWLTMEYLQGTDAKQLLRERGPLPLALVAEIVSGVAAALDYAYEDFAITHRDVKPANVLVRLRNGRVSAVKLVDFGIAKASTEASSLTVTGTTVGTLGYLSPEAINGVELDNRTDLYSLATAAFELLTGAPPFAGTTIAAVMGAHLYQPVPALHLRGPGLPPELDAVFERALAKDPTERYATSGEFAAALAAIAAAAPDARAAAPSDEDEVDPHYAATTVRQAGPGDDDATTVLPPSSVPAAPAIVGGTPAVELRRGETVDLPAAAEQRLLVTPPRSRAESDLFALVVDGDARVLSEQHLVFYNNPRDPGGIAALTPGDDAGLVLVPRLLPPGARIVVAVASDAPEPTRPTVPAVTVECEGGAWAVPTAPEPGLRAAVLCEAYHRDTADGRVLRLRAIAQGWTDGVAALVRGYGVEVDEGA